MTPEQATFLSQYLLQQLENEQKTTTKVIAAVPFEKGDYKPDPKSRSAKELAWHIAQVDVWFLDSIANGSFEYGESPMPDSFKSSDQLAKWYDEKFAAGLAKVRTLSGETMSKVMDFLGVFQLPAVMYLSFANNHMIHHRGQLAAYLRPMGSKVPSIYGGSADEPFDMQASA